MSEVKEGYKVCRVFNDKFLSIAAFNQGGCVQYEIGSITHPIPQNGPLAIFEALGEAISFIKTQIPNKELCRIFKCRYEHNLGNKLWEYLDGYLYYMEENEFPEGTVLASWVELTEEIKQDEWI